MVASAAIAIFVEGPRPDRTAVVACVICVLAVIGPASGAAALFAAQAVRAAGAKRVAIGALLVFVVAAPSLHQYKTLVARPR